MSKEKKEKAKSFIQNNKKKLIGAGLLLVAGLCYVFFDVEIDVEKMTNAVCVFFGGCQ